MAINTKSSAGNQISAPAVQLVKSSVTQIPVHAEHSIVFSKGEPAKVLVKMRDGTCVYISENDLSQDGGKVRI